MMRLGTGWPAAALRAALPLVAAPLTASAQSPDGHAFIDFSPSAAAAAPPAPNPAHVEALREQEAGYGYRLVSIDILIRANGDVEQTRRTVIDYANAAGIELQGNASVLVNAYADRLEISEARVTTPDGLVVEVDPDTVQVLLEDNGSVFSDDHEVVVPWPSLAPGSVSALTYWLSTSREKLAAPWSQLVFPKMLVPTQRFELAVTWENEAVRPELETDFARLRCNEEARSIRCESDDTGAMQLDSAVNYFDELPQVLIAERTSWDELARLLNGYVRQSWTNEDEITEVAAGLIDGVDTDVEKLKALHSFVSREIRYVGIETGVNGIIPRETGLTLARRYGDCKDKTALFLQMAEIAGINAMAFVVSSHRKKLDKLIAPSLAYFDHMVACVGDEDGFTCVDLTDPYTPSGAFPRHLAGAPAIPLDDTGVEAPHRFVGPAFGWTLSVDSSNELIDTTIREIETRTFGPIYSGALRASLSGLNRAEIRRWAEDDYEEVFGIDADLEFDVRGLEDQQAPVTIRSETQLENAVLDGEFMHYEHFPGWLVNLARRVYIDNEHYDYFFEGFAYSEKTSFALDEWRFVAPGAELDFDSEFGFMRRAYSFDDGIVSVRTNVALQRRLVAREEFDRFNRFLDTVVENSLIRFRAEP